MTRTNLLDMNKFSPFVVGFDRFFDQMLDSQAQGAGKEQPTNFALQKYGLSLLILGYCSAYVAGVVKRRTASKKKNWMTQYHP